MEKEIKKFHPSSKLKSVMINQDDDLIKIANLLNKDIIDMNITVRAMNCLKNNGYNKIEDILYFGEKGILKLRNSGNKTLLDIKRELESLGLKFPYVIPPAKIYYEYVVNILGVRNPIRRRS